MHHNPAALPMPNAFDAIVVIILLWGLNKGRKHGMSEELMIMLQWIAIVVAGAYLYRPFGDMLALSSPVSHLFCYITIYVTTAIVTKILFALIKKATGGKLVGSSIFGAAEYYLGMIAGAVRYACMLIAALALLNAPYYSQADIAAARAYQDKEFGSNYFPELSGIQQTVFNESVVGSMIKERAGVLLIASTKFEKKAIERRKDDHPW